MNETLIIEAKIFELEQLVADLRRVIDFLRVDEPAKERAAVVAWLREDWPFRDDRETRALDLAADSIELGEHRRTGEEK